MSDKANRINLFKIHSGPDRQTIIVSLLSVLVGIIAGFGAVGFRYLIGFFHNLFFLGKLSFHFNSELPFVTSWGIFVILVPAVGITLANFMTEKWAPEAKGHGVPEVMSAVMVDRGKIRPSVSLIKSLASAITIGSGGSVGREGPIIQIGASFGSTLGQSLKLKPKEVIVLVGAGVAGGIGATFNAPIGGIMFALELILPEYSIMTILPLAVSSIIATRISGLILGTTPAFILPEYMLESSWELAFYLVLGLAAGMFAVFFIHSLYGIEDFFKRLRLPSTVKSIVGGLILGLVGLACLKIFGHYYIFGVGYAFLTEVLTGNSSVLIVLVALLFIKIIATSLTLAAGGSGGIFAPSLFMGAAVGAIIGLIVNTLFPEITAGPSAYAIVGMAAMVSGVTGASLTSIIMTFEMTRNYEIMLPLMLSVVVAHFVSHFIYKETIYTKKLTRRGVMIELHKRIPIFNTMSVGEVMNTDIISVTSDAVISDVLEKMHEKAIGLLPVIDESSVVGTISYEELYRSGCEKTGSIKELVNRRTIDIKPGRNLFDALSLMGRLKTNILIVVDMGEVRGFITRNRIITSYLAKRSRL